MFKNFLLKKMLKSKLNGMPEAEQDKLIEMIEKNPKLFHTIAKEAQTKIENGKDQMTAMMEVMQNHQEELRKAIG